MDHDTGPVPPPEDAAEVAGLRVVTLGPGGVGGLLGGLLARGGASTTCLPGDTTAAILRERGLRVDSGRFGDFTVPVRAVERLAEPVGVCLVTVKATQLERRWSGFRRRSWAARSWYRCSNGVEHVPALSVGRSGGGHHPGRVHPARRPPRECWTTSGCSGCWPRVRMPSRVAHARLVGRPVQPATRHPHGSLRPSDEAGIGFRSRDDAEATLRRVD